MIEIDTLAVFNPTAKADILPQGGTEITMKAEVGLHHGQSCLTLKGDIMDHYLKLQAYEAELAECEAFWGAGSIMCSLQRGLVSAEKAKLDDAVDAWDQNCMGFAFGDDDFPDDF